MLFIFLKKLLILLSLFLIFALASGGLYFYASLQGVCQKNCKTQIFVVPKGTSLNEVLHKLEKEKIIKNAFAAKIYLKLIGYHRNIQAGDFKLNPSYGIDGIISSLQKGTIDFWVTIPEGYRAEQIYEKVQKARNENSNSDENSPEISGNIDKSKLKLKIYIDNEGYLFPDTYLVPKNSNDEDVVKIMKNNFGNKINSIIFANKPNASFSNENWKLIDKININNYDEVTIRDLIILASLVEREAKNDSERPIIANIIYKRWKANWPLQVDATIQYIVGKPGNWWKKDLTFDDLKVESPYNTYLHKGLPPAPICNPGLKAINAVINQTKTDYWFYATGKDGVTRYSKTLEDHNLNVKQNIN